MRTSFSSRRILFQAIPVAGLVLAPVWLRAQEGDWSKHVKAADRALRSDRREKAEEELRAALAATEGFPAKDPRTAETIGKLAEVYIRESKFAEAEDLLKREVAVTEAATGADGPRLADVLIRLALAYERDDRPGDAAPLWGRSIAILEKAGRPVDPGVLSEIKQVAIRLRMDGSNEKGEEQTDRALLELSESLGASELDLRFARATLAYLYERTGRYAQAEPLRNGILKMDEKESGAESPAVGNDLGALADLYTSEGKYDAALPLLQRRLEIVEKNNPPDPSAGKHKELKSALADVVIVPQIPVILLSQGSVGYVPFDPSRRSSQAEVFSCYKDLAKGYANAGKYAEAEGMYQQIIETEDKQSEGKAADGKNANPARSLASTTLFYDLIDFARVYRDDHKYNEALETIRRAGTIGKEIADSKFEQQNAKITSPLLYPWLSEIELAEIDREMGDTTAAAAAFEQSLRRVDDLKLPPGSPKLAEMLGNYATLLRDAGKYDESEALYKRSIDAWERSGRSGDPQFAGALMNYADLLRKVHRPSEAEALEARAAALHD